MRRPDRVLAWLPRLLGVVLTLVSASAVAQPRPNIVYIVADDLDAAMFQEAAGLQRLLGEQGMTFDRHYISLPMCCPSRATMLRGQFGHNTGVLGNQEPVGGFWKFQANGLDQSTVATWLRDGGYRTGMIGKYLNGYGMVDGSYVPPGWDYWVSPAAGTPYLQYNYTLNVNGTPQSHGALETDYLDDVLARYAARFIRSSTDGRPFFLYLAPYNPHGPGGPPPRYSTGHAKSLPWRPGSYDEADTSDKPAFIRDMPPLSLEQQERMDRIYARRRIAMLTLRDLVGVVLRTLERTGHLEDTYVVFTSDNGYHLGEHRMGSGKSTAYEEDIRVPLVVRGPGIAPGSHSGALTTNADFAPTFAEMAGVTPPEFVDGRSFFSFLTGGAPSEWRDAVLLEGADPMPLAYTDPVLEPPEPINPWKAPPPRYRGIRTLTHTYVEWDNGERELYDNVADPMQLDSIAATASPAELGYLHSWLASLVDASGATLRAGEIAPSPVAPPPDDPPPTDPPPTDPPPTDPPPTDPPPTDPPPTDPPPTDPPPIDPA